ncbi:MAG: hypothetical protein Q9198_010470, partial [Flavoplaca austrocitrina]
MPLCSRVRKVRRQKVLLLRHPVPYSQPLPPLLLHKLQRPHQLLQAPTLLSPHNKCLLYLLSLQAERSKPLHQPLSRPHRSPRRFRRFLITLILLSAFGFAGGTYYSLLSDNFHDFFTEYVPFGEDAVLYFEEREFRRRFPSMTNPTNRPSPPANTITIPSKSGLSWKVSEEDQKGSDLEKKGRHMSALDSNPPKPAKENAQRTPTVATGSEKVQAVEQAKKDSSASSRTSDASAKASEKQATPAPSKESEKVAPAPAPASSPPPAQKPETKSQDAATRPPE